MDCLDRADGRNAETQLEERRDNVACVGGVAGEEGNGNEVDVERICVDGGEAAPLRRGGRGARILMGDWEVTLVAMSAGNLCGGEGGLISASIRFPVCGIGDGDCVTIVV